VKPVNAKALAMPVPDGPAVTSAGVARVSSPLDWKSRFGRDLHFVPFLKGNVVGGLFDQEDNGKFDLHKARLAYLLLRQAKIPASHYLRNGVTKFLPYVAVSLAKKLKEWASGR
jgi:hypothetical protein